MKDSTKRKIKHIGVMLFLLYVLLLVYFLFFFEEYGRVAAEERVYRYNLIPFLEIRRFWIYREQLGVLAVFSNIFGNVIDLFHMDLYFRLLHINAVADFLLYCQDFH